MSYALVLVWHIKFVVTCFWGSSNRLPKGTCVGRSCGVDNVSAFFGVLSAFAWAFGDGTVTYPPAHDQCARLQVLRVYVALAHKQKTLAFFFLLFNKTFYLSLAHEACARAHKTPPVRCYRRAV